MKWTELTPEQQIKAVEYNVDPECIRDDAYEAASDYRENLLGGHDAVFMSFETLVDWWDNCDDETQREILGLDPLPEPPKPE